jgi:S1-C subfamily serine protease
MSVTIETPKAGVLGVSGANWSERGASGVEILDIALDSPAEIAGLHIHEVITDVNGRRIRSTQDLAAVLAQNEPGSKIVLGYIFKSNLGWMPKETMIILADK